MKIVDVILTILIGLGLVFALISVVVGAKLQRQQRKKVREAVSTGEAEKDRESIKNELIENELFKLERDRELLKNKLSELEKEVRLIFEECKPLGNQYLNKHDGISHIYGIFDDVNIGIKYEDYRFVSRCEDLYHMRIYIYLDNIDTDKWFNEENHGAYLESLCRVLIPMYHIIYHSGTFENMSVSFSVNMPHREWTGAWKTKTAVDLHIRKEVLDVCQFDRVENLAPMLVEGNKVGDITFKENKGGK